MPGRAALLGQALLERGAAQTQRRSVFSAENGEERDAVADFRALRGSCEYQV